MIKNDFDYSSPENQLESRSAMSGTLRGGLIQLPRDAWADDPRFRGEPEFWLQIHKALLEASAELPVLCEQLMAAIEDKSDDISARLDRVRSLALQLTHHAHGHHHIEDHHFFPVFARAVPSLGTHLELLDGDHRILSDVLDDMETGAAALPSALVGQSADTSAKLDDLILAPTERLSQTARKVDLLFGRHIGDEEEICIPVMLLK